MLGLRATDGVVVWRRPVGARSAHPVVSSGDGALYLSLADSRLIALNLETGELMWEQQLSGTLSEPWAARDRSSWARPTHFLNAFNRGGTFQWRWRNGGDVIGVATRTMSLRRVARQHHPRCHRGNGNQRWKRPTGTRPTAPPRAFGGTVVLVGIKPAVLTSSERPVRPGHLRGRG